MNEVKAWTDKVTIPTYGIGEAEKNPIFLEKRVYQGSSGKVYPHAVVEKILDEKVDQVYEAVFIENEYLKIMILPELGGRVQMAFDKIRQRHFIYYNQVIKPALVGLTGPWISGGIEFNWPQHHRPSTYLPVDYTIEENPDGSKTIWVNEVEQMFRTKGMAGFTLYPGKAYLEIKGKLFNRTPFAQTFLWWANPAVKVNDDYQSVFPPDVYAVFDHGKRDVSSFPIATGTYYKVDYSPGTDISRYKNIPVPTSYMAIRSKYDFMGGYEHDTQAGLLHVANHHVSPGKKQWTWGHSDFGKAWDRNLTDEDGPYIELMTGMFTDNQPDFSWLQPNEEKTFEQYFMPYAELGMVKNATKEAMVNLEVNTDKVKFMVYVTGIYPAAEIGLSCNNQVVYHTTADLSPENIFIHEWETNQKIDDGALDLVVRSSTGMVLVEYRPETVADMDIPQAATAAKHPSEIGSIEDLYLNGLHIEQYRHATFVATDYYLEALKREPNDIRNNNAMGLWFLKRGQPALAEPYFRTAIATLTSRNPNPYNGEVYYNLGILLMLQDRLAEAFDILYKATWNGALQDVAYLALARTTSRQQKYQEALSLIEKSLVRNYHSHAARHLKTSLLRITGQTEQARLFAMDSIAIDPFNYGCLYEIYLITDDASDISYLKTLIGGRVQTYIEYALDYAAAGFYREAIELLELNVTDKNDVYPMVYYYMADFASRSGNDGKAKGYYQLAAVMSSDYCFPHRVEDVGVLQKAVKANPADAKALYYLGNYWYDKREYPEAIDCWERSVASDDCFPTVHRNLCLACFNKKQDSGTALQYMEKAFSLNTDDARILMELDQLYKILNHPLQKRLTFLEQYPALVLQRDDLYLEKISLLNQLGNYEKAKALISVRQFHPWEGGEGKIVGQFLMAQTQLAKQALLNGDYALAISYIDETENYPHNLGEGKLYGTPENDLHYLKGLVYEAMGDEPKAEYFFKQATTGSQEPVQAIFYNDPQPDKIFYQGLAWMKLNAPEKAEAIFKRLVNFGESHLEDEIKIDYFAVSLPDLLVFDVDLNEKNKLHCYYLMALGYLGLKQFNKANDLFKLVLEQNVAHNGAEIHSDI
jgi:Tfp pilus assembly protein PilF